jgi:hypothetical protein
MENEASLEQERLIEARSVETKPKLKFLERTGIYGLELAVAMITVLIIASVLSVGAYALSRYLYGAPGSVSGQLALWSAASTIVWLPVAYIFYQRSRAYMERNPAVVNEPVQRAFVVIYQVIAILSVIGFAFSAVYSMLNAFVEAEDMIRTLVTVSLPSFISAVVFAGVFIAFFRHPVVSRKVFANSLLITSLLIVIPVIIYSMVVLRAVNVDNNRTSDLERLRSAINSEYSAERELPESLGDLSQNVEDIVNEPVDNYEYKRLSSNEYQLCATFNNDTTKDSRSSSTYYNYESSNDYGRHSAGKQCYTETQRAYDYNWYNSSDYKEPVR